MRHISVFLAMLCGVTMMPVVVESAVPSEPVDSEARFIPASIPGGICVVLGSTDSDLPLSVSETSQLLVHALFEEPTQLQRARDAIRTAGVYGRVSADRCDFTRLPYAENLINVVLIERFEELEKCGLSLNEINRVVAPLGQICLIAGRVSEGRDPAWKARWSSRVKAAGFFDVRVTVRDDRVWLSATKPWPSDIDEWTHHLHSADGNPVANDLQVGPPKHYRWIADPIWMQSHESDSSLRCLVTARGRLYFIVNEAPTSLAGPESPPDKWFLTARDAFNGVLLWKTPVKQWGWREWKPSWFTPRPGVIPINLDKRVVAAADKLYVTLGFRAPVSEMDGRTGELLKTYDGSERASEILYHGGQLLLTVLLDERAVVKRFDAASGKELWTSDKDYAGTTTDYYRFTAMNGRVPEAKVDPTLDIATDGHVVGLLDRDSVVCLDFKTGAEKWRHEFPLVKADFNAGRIDARQKVWTGTMIISDGVIIHASPNQLAAFSAETGEILWKQPKKFLQHLWYEWKDVFVIDGLVWTWSSELVSDRLQGPKAGNSSWPKSINGYDLQTGSLQREVALANIFKTNHHHRCYRNKATVRYVLASRRGTEFVDLAGGEHSVNNWVRGICHMGMVPANGLQYAPPHPCSCYIDEKLNAMNALAAARPNSTSRDDRLKQDDRWLERGPADPSPSARPADPASCTADDWPTFRGDSARSGSTSARLPQSLKLLWQERFGHKIAAPISVADRVFAPLVDEHQIIAISTKDGSELWRFTAGARIDSPPTYDRGAILFGSADGCVYRVAADTGQLVWRRRVVPEDRRIAAFGQLESAWPVSGNVLVDSNPAVNSGQPLAVFVAGRSSHLDGGLQLCAVDAMTGTMHKQRTLSGPEYTSDNVEQNFGLPMGWLPDILRKEGSSLFMRSFKFDTDLVEQRGISNMKLRSSFLDDAYFKRMPWSIGKSGHARTLVYDTDHAYCLRMFDSMQGLDPKVFFTPARKGYLLFGHDLKSGKNTWQIRIPIRGRAMAVAADQLVVAGPPDLIDPNDPLAAFEGGLGGVLRVVDKQNGHTVSEQELSMPPVFNGAAVANGRLYLSLEDGSIACFGE